MVVHESILYFNHLNNSALWLYFKSREIIFYFFEGIKLMVIKH